MFFDKWCVIAFVLISRVKCIYKPPNSIRQYDEVIKFDKWDEMSYILHESFFISCKVILGNVVWLSFVFALINVTLINKSVAKLFMPMRTSYETILWAFFKTGLLFYSHAKKIHSGHCVSSVARPLRNRNLFWSVCPNKQVWFNSLKYVITVVFHE